MRPISEVRKLVAALGLVPDEVASAELRQAATLSWFHRNILVLRRRGVAAVEAHGVSVAHHEHARRDRGGALLPLPAGVPTSTGGAGMELTQARALFAKLRVAAAELAGAAELDAPLDALEAEFGRLP